MASNSDSEGEQASATDRAGITTVCCDDAYDLEPARQASERKTGFYLVLINSRRNNLFSIAFDKFIIPRLYVALFT
jgi:hypothetical protein